MDRAPGSHMDHILATIGDASYILSSFAIQSLILQKEGNGRRFKHCHSISYFPSAILQAENTEDLHPPVSLSQHPPLAIFTNSVLTAFNELRHCAPLSLVSQVAEELQSAFSSLIQTTLAFHR